METLPFDIIKLIVPNATIWHNVCLAFSEVGRKYVLQCNPKLNAIIQNHFTKLIVINDRDIEIRYWITTTSKFPRFHRIGEPAYEVFHSKTKQIITYAWFKKGHLHRDDNDKPALYNPAGLITRTNYSRCTIEEGESTEWWKDGMRHRKGDKPAVIYSDGSMIWYFEGKVHREKDEPAVIRRSSKKTSQLIECTLTTQGATRGKEWFINGLRHRDNGKPAIINTDGSEEYWMNGRMHREGDLPALIKNKGKERGWYLNGMQHRDNDLPSYINKGSTQKWHQHGKLHRGDDKPAIVWDNGDKYWYQHDLLHRWEGQPAVLLVNGTKKWYLHGEPHRSMNNGPAVVLPNGTLVWYEHGDLKRIVEPIKRRRLK